MNFGSGTEMSATRKLLILISVVGIGAVPGVPPPHVYRTGGFPNFFGTTFPLVIVTGTHGVLIAGCFAEGATVPVELQSFSIE